MKIVVVGNCQARPLTQVFQRGSAAETLTPIILHLSKASDEQEHTLLFNEADVILCQFTAPTFEPNHLAMRNLKSLYPSKVIVWPNIFYSGQQPRLRYMTHTQKGRIIGPLDAYHDLQLVSQWYLDRLGFNPFTGQPSDAEIQELSISQLKERETDCDVVVSDIIEENVNNRRLFFTFNHPTFWLLEMLSRRVSEQIGLQVSLNKGSDWEPLGQIVPPSNLVDIDAADAVFSGFQTNASDAKNTRQKKTFSSVELREETFICYDTQRELLEDNQNIRLTPQFNTVT